MPRIKINHSFCSPSQPGGGNKHAEHGGLSSVSQDWLQYIADHSRSQVPSKSRRETMIKDFKDSGLYFNNLLFCCYFRDMVKFQSERKRSENTEGYYLGSPTLAPVVQTCFIVELISVWSISTYLLGLGSQLSC